MRKTKVPCGAAALKQEKGLSPKYIDRHASVLGRQRRFDGLSQVTGLLQAERYLSIFIARIVRR